jgi:hypothetical protein
MNPIQEQNNKTIKMNSIQEEQEKPCCVKCNLNLRSTAILYRHLQYNHDIYKGLPVCMFKGCKNRPNRNNRTMCGRHCTPETNIKLLSLTDCKKIIKQPKIMKIASVKKQPNIDIIHDLGDLSI